MNNMRRDAISRLREKLDAISSELERLRTEEEIALGNLAKDVQAGQKGEHMKRVMEHLGDAIRCVDTADSFLGLAVK